MLRVFNIELIQPIRVQVLHTNHKIILPRVDTASGQFEPGVANGLREQNFE
jgi:hypothetical protein